MREDRKKRNAIIICLFVLMICITGSTYAYFALTASNNTSVTGSVGVTGSLTLTVEKLYSTSSNKMIPQLEASLDRAISNEFNCEDSSGNVVCHVYKVKIKNTSGDVKINGTIKFTSMSGLSNLKWKRLDYDTNTSKPVIGNYTSNSASTAKVNFIENEEFIANEEKDFYLVVWLDETGSVQTDSGTYKATIDIDTAEGGLTSTVASLLTEHIVSLYSDARANVVHIAGDSSKPEVSLDSTSSIVLDNNGDYRYYGATPNNYIEYNGELWRIVSVSKVFSSTEDTTGETRVRIIKDTSIGDYAWNTGGTNNWSDATLMCQLNTMYYNDTKQACSNKSLTSLNTSLNAEASSLIDNALWYLGGGDNTDLYVDDYYIMERGTAVADASYPSRWTGKVGLMYPSDYAYAADLSKCTKTGYNYMDRDSWEPDPNCAGTDWLFNGEYQWLISPYSDDSYFVWYAYGTGFVRFDGGNVEVYGSVHPLLVLKPNVIITGGEGTSGNPYKLRLGT